MSRDPKWLTDLDVASGRAYRYSDAAWAWLRYLVGRLPKGERAKATALIKQGKFPAAHAEPEAK